MESRHGEGDFSLSSILPLVSQVWETIQTNFHGFRDDTYLQKFRSLLVHQIKKKDSSHYVSFELHLIIRRDFRQSLSFLRYVLLLYAQIVGKHPQARKDIQRFLEMNPESVAQVYSSVEFLELMDVLVSSEPLDQKVYLALAQENILKLLANPHEHQPKNVFWRRSFFKLNLTVLRKVFRMSPTIAHGPDSFPRRLVFHPNLPFKRSLFMEFIMGVIQHPGLPELKHSPAFVDFMRDWSQSPEIRVHADCQIIYGISIWKDVQSCVEPYFYPELKLTTRNDLRSVLEPLSTLINRELVCYKDNSLVPRHIINDMKQNLKTRTNMWRNVIILRLFTFPEVAVDHLKVILSGDHDLSDREVPDFIRYLCYHTIYGSVLDSSFALPKNHSEVIGLLIELSLRKDLALKSRVESLKTLNQIISFEESSKPPFEKYFDTIWILATDEHWEIVDEFLELLACATDHLTITQSNLDKILNFLKICLDHESSFIRANVFVVLSKMIFYQDTLRLILKTKMSIPLQVREVLEHETEAVVRREAASCLSAYSRGVLYFNPPNLFLFETMYLAVLDPDWEVKTIALESFWANPIKNCNLDPNFMSETFMVNVCLFVLEDHDKRNRKLFSYFIERLMSDDPTAFDSSNVEEYNSIKVEIEPKNKYWILRELSSNAKHAQCKDIIRIPPKEPLSVLMDKVKALDYNDWIGEFDYQNSPAKELKDVMLDILHYDGQSESEVNTVDCV